MYMYVSLDRVEGYHLPASEVLDHFVSVLSDSQLVVWLSMDYSQILLQHIITIPHYVLSIPAQMWNGEPAWSCISVCVQESAVSKLSYHPLIASKLTMNMCRIM